MKLFCFIKNYTYREIKTFEKTTKLDAKINIFDRFKLDNGALNSCRCRSIVKQ